MPISRRALINAAALATAASLAPRVARAAYPERPVRLIVPFVPGGAVDAVGRLKTLVQEARSWRLEFELPAVLMRFVAPSNVSIGVNTSPPTSGIQIVSYPSSSSSAAASAARPASP